MKILFIVPHVRPYNSQSVREQPTGGTERAATFLGEALMRLGHEVRWITTFTDALEFDTVWPEVVITQHAEYFLKLPTHTRKIWWCHQATDRPFPFVLSRSHHVEGRKQHAGGLGKQANLHHR